MFTKIASGVAAFAIGEAFSYNVSSHMLGEFLFTFSDIEKRLEIAEKKSFHSRSPSPLGPALHHIPHLKASPTYEGKEGGHELVYVPDKQAQGHKGISHGGFTFTLLDLFGESLYRSQPDRIFIRYTKPAMVGEAHHVYGTFKEDNKIYVEVKNMDGQLVAFLESK